MKSLLMPKKQFFVNLINKYYFLIFFISFQSIAADSLLPLNDSYSAFRKSFSGTEKHSTNALSNGVVQIDADALIEKENFEIELPDGKSYYAVATVVERLGDNKWNWKGILSAADNAPDRALFSEGAANLTIVDGLTSGHLTLPHATYKLIPHNETESFVQKTEDILQLQHYLQEDDQNKPEEELAFQGLTSKSSNRIDTITKQTPVKKIPIKISRKVIKKAKLNVPNYFYKTANLMLLYGGGEFVFKMDEFDVPEQQSLNFEWSTTVNNAVGGRWEVKNLSTSTIVASNVVFSAPQPGHFRFFTIPADRFLFAEPPQQNTIFEVRIMPLDSSGKVIGSGSGAVKITQLASENVAPITQFDDGANFPKIELVSYSPQIGQVPLTQLFYEYADVKVRVRNLSQKKTDPMWLTVKDNSLLFRQDGLMSLPELNPGEMIIRDIRLNAILPPASSQTPEAEQHRLWLRQYDNKCGAELRSFLEWRGPSSQTPINATQESFLVQPEWEDYAISPSNRRICDNGQCVKTCDIEKNIRKMLDGRTVGYSFFLGQWPHGGGSGDARMGEDGDLPFTAKTKITVASVSKLITAIGALRILEQNNVAVTDPIGPFLPDDWDVNPYLASVTFGQFLSQSSGIMDYGNVAMTFDQLQFFFEQDLDPNAQPECTGANANPRPQPVDQTTPGGCYSNYNTGIFRILLPHVAGLAINTNSAIRARIYADQYEALINEHVFARVGVSGTACRPVASAPHAFAYSFGHQGSGIDWGDVSDQCGAAGWYLSAEDMGRVLLSINARDGKILRETPRFPGDPVPSQFDQLRTMGLGLDINGPDWIEKNGGWSGCNENNECGSIATTAAIFGPGALPNPNVVGVLFINSNINDPLPDCQGNPCSSPRAVLRKAYDDALTPQ